jgi:hypothetical protein
MLSTRNALIGWATLIVARRYAKRRVRRTQARLHFGR